MNIFLQNLFTSVKNVVLVPETSMSIQYTR